MDLCGWKLMCFVSRRLIEQGTRQWLNHWWPSRNNFVNAPSQWETTLHCNIISHWLGAYTKWSLTYFYPRPVLAFGYCRCLRLSVCPSVRVCGNHLLVRAITRHPFKLGSPNLDHRCKRPWLRSLLFWGVIDLDLQGQIKLQSQKLPHFELLGTITHHLFKLGSPNLGKRCKIPGLRLLLTLGLIGLDLQFHFQFWNPFA